MLFGDYFFIFISWVRLKCDLKVRSKLSYFNDDFNQFQYLYLSSNLKMGENNFAVLSLNIDSSISIDLEKRPI